MHALETSQVQKWAPAEIATVLCEYASYGRASAAHLAIHVRARNFSAVIPSEQPHAVSFVRFISSFYAVASTVRQHRQSLTNQASASVRLRTVCARSVSCIAPYSVGAKRWVSSVGCAGSGHCSYVFAHQHQRSAGLASASCGFKMTSAPEIAAQHDLGVLCQGNDLLCYQNPRFWIS